MRPAGLAFEANAGETVMQAAVRNGLAWPTVCGGMGECRACVLRLIGGEGLSPMRSTEEVGLRSLPPHLAKEGNARLACQAVVTGNVEVFKRGVR